MPVRLIQSLATTEPLSEVFSDSSILRAMLHFEVALARVEALCGIIPPGAAEAIAKAAVPASFDPEELSRQALRAGTLTLPLVKELRSRVQAIDPPSADYVHWGATSQDVSDTAMVLLLTAARKQFAADHERLCAALRLLSDLHANTIMLGRTLLQAAPPVTFGLKAAGWLGAIERSWTNLASEFESARVLQFGGATGTLAALGDRGIEVSEKLALELGLHNPPAPWHAHRDRLASLVCACGIYTGCLSKMALDVALLMQDEVAEASEPGGNGRGGSSTMPHKHNPTACAIALASANSVPGYVSNFLHGMSQAHERSVGGWQAEWNTLALVIQATALALASMVEVSEGLKVHPEHMRANLDATRGVIFAERVMFLLSPKLGRERAHALVSELTRKAIDEQRPLTDVLRELPEAAAALSSDEIASLNSPQTYLGSAEAFRSRLIGQSLFKQTLT